MFCMHCGKQIADDALFCEYCGKSTSTSANPSSELNVTGNSMITSKKKQNYIGIIIIGLVVCVVGLLFSILMNEPAEPEFVSWVENGYLGDYTSVSIGEVFNASWKNGIWDGGTTDDNKKLVTFSSKQEVEELDLSTEVTIQFTVFDDQHFQVTAFVVDGVSPQTDAEAATLLESRYIGYFSQKYPDKAPIEFMSDAPAENVLFGASADYNGSRLFVEMTPPIEISEMDLSDPASTEAEIETTTSVTILQDAQSDCALSYLGKQISDVVAEFGADYTIKGSSGSTMLVYPNLPYSFAQGQYVDYLIPTATVASMYVQEGGYITDHYYVGMTSEELGLSDPTHHEVGDNWASSVTLSVNGMDTFVQFYFDGSAGKSMRAFIKCDELMHQSEWIVTDENAEEIAIQFLNSFETDIPMTYELVDDGDYYFLFVHARESNTPSSLLGNFRISKLDGNVYDFMQDTLVWQYLT